jgi:putative transposase
VKVVRQYRIYPDEKQRQTIMQTFGCVRAVYNACLDAINQHYQEWVEKGKPEGQLDTSTPKISELKPDKPWFANADSLALSVARMDFFNALDSYYKSRNGQRKGQKVGFPKHKKRGKCKFSYTTCNQGNNIRFDADNTHIKLPKLGWVKIIKHRSMPEGVIGRVYVSMNRAEEFYVSINVECDQKQPLLSKSGHIGDLRVVGLDMSLSSFCVSSDKNDDTITKYIRNYRKEEEHLARLQRRLSKKKKYGVEEIDGKTRHIETQNHRKARLKLAKLHLKIQRRRREFVIKMARYFAMKYDVICIEDLNMRNMSQTLRLGKSVMDIGWGLFCEWLEFECEKYDTVIVKADKWFASSKTCNKCGSKNGELKLSDRAWVCPVCGAEIDRDRNAAINLRDYAKREITSLGTWEVNDRGAYATLRETLSGLRSENRR